MKCLRNIEVERVRRGISKKDLCDELDITPKTYSNYINGKSNVPSSKLIELSKTFNCSIDYLLGLKNPPA